MQMWSFHSVLLYIITDTVDRIQDLFLSRIPSEGETYCSRVSVLYGEARFDKDVRGCEAVGVTSCSLAGFNEAVALRQQISSINAFKALFQVHLEINAIFL